MVLLSTEKLTRAKCSASYGQQEGVSLEVWFSARRFARFCAIVEPGRLQLRDVLHLGNQPYSRGID
jgi:hypothetical protein